MSESEVSWGVYPSLVVGTLKYKVALLADRDDMNTWTVQRHYQNF